MNPCVPDQVQGRIHPVAWLGGIQPSIPEPPSKSLLHIALNGTRIRAVKVRTIWSHWRVT